MSYKVNFTDTTIHPDPIEVADNTTNVDTSIKLPGRNQTGYGQIIAENFLHLLENFASATPPNSAKAVPGQLWFDTTQNQLFVFDGVSWKSTSNIKVAVNEPDPANSVIGDLWVNTSTQQLYLFGGTGYILVGPQFSSGTKSGPLVETIVDIDNNRRTVIINYTNDIPVSIISKDTFVPKVVIQGFNTINSGVNITTRNDISDAVVTPKFNGTATASDALNVGSTVVPADIFLRSDTIGTTSKQFNIRADEGLTVGTNGNFSVRVGAATGILYNSTPGAAIDIQPTKTGSGQQATVVRVVEDKVGINHLNPQETVDVVGNIRTTGDFITTSETDSTNLANGSIRTGGGVAVSKNIIVGGDVKVLNGTLYTRSLTPLTNSETLGRSDNQYSTVYAKNIVADTIKGTLTGNINGTANSAASLSSTTNFKLEGDVQSNLVAFNGTGNLNKVFTTQLTSDIISNKTSVANSLDTDEILIYRNSAGLRKTTRSTFFDDLSVPVGSIFPFAGQTAPTGYLLCDGSEFELYRYRQLGELLGSRYNGSAPLIGSSRSTTFRVPDLRGRFVLGKQDMDNHANMPSTSTVSALTTLASPRVKDSNANVLGGTGGSDEYVIESYNIPDHDHDMKGRRADNAPSGTQFYSINDLTAAPADYGPQTAIGGVGSLNVRKAYGTLPNSSQWMSSSGLVRIANEAKRVPGLADSAVGRPFGVLNPYIALNYIIRSGKPND